MATTYAGLPIKNPWGKASGQLSMTGRQVQDDVDAGLGFVVLKTLIAEDETGAQMMHAWTVKEPRMLVEPVTGRSGAAGWTTPFRSGVGTSYPISPGPSRPWVPASPGIRPNSWKRAN